MTEARRLDEAWEGSEPVGQPGPELTLILNLPPGAWRKGDPVIGFDGPPPTVETTDTASVSHPPLSDSAKLAAWLSITGPGLPVHQVREGPYPINFSGYRY